MKVVRSLLPALYFLIAWTSTAMGTCISGDCADGQGTYAYPDGSVYVGQWKNSMRNGQGTYTLSDGSIYVGQWKNSMRNGQGTYTLSDGSKHVGRWENDKLIKEDNVPLSLAEVLSREIMDKLEKKTAVPETREKNGITVVKTAEVEETTVQKEAEEETIVQERPEVKTGKTFIGPNGIKFVYVSPGTFMMGCPEDELGRYDNETLHRVTLTKGFYIQTTEVTQGQWKAVMGNNPSYFKSCGDDCPVEQVSWKDVQQFIWRLNQLEGLDKYRLPTEAEWEYACRAGSSTAFCSGGITALECGHDPNLDAVAWFCGNSGKKTSPVARKNANAWGLYDMHGNVSEFCRDWYEKYSPDDITDPAGAASGLDRIVRGGGLDTHAGHCRSACRGALSQDIMGYGIGFRLAGTP